MEDNGRVGEEGWIGHWAAEHVLLFLTMMSVMEPSLHTAASSDQKNNAC